MISKFPDLTRRNGIFVFVCLMACASPSWGEGPWGATDIKLYGVSLQVSPAEQTVPLSTPTVVTTALGSGEQGFPETMMVHGDLRGPSITGEKTLSTRPNNPFLIPGLGLQGSYVLDNIRLVNGDAVLFFAQPRSVVINATQVLITKVESRPLTLQEIRQYGIVIDQSNFNAIKVSVAFMLGSKEVRYDIPVFMPKSGPPRAIPSPAGGGGGVQMGSVDGEIPEFSIEAIKFEMPDLEQDLPAMRPITGVIAFTNQFGYLHQFFSVLLMVTNGAPGGDPLKLTDLTGKILLDQDKLREAKTVPPTPMGQPVSVRDPGPDGKLGTADDVSIIAAAMTGKAEYLVEGLAEGTHDVRFDIAGTLEGMPSGPVAITGEARGAVVVRDPDFTLTFTHPSVVRRLEEYDLLITVTNTSDVPANLVTLRLPVNRLFGVRLRSDQQIVFDTIEPGDSAVGRYRLESLRTGEVRATSFKTSSADVRGKWDIEVRVGDSGIPLSPDTIRLPASADVFDPDFLDYSISLLGLGHSVATAPPGSLQSNLTAIPRGVINLRAVELAEAGRRAQLLQACSEESDRPALVREAVRSVCLDWLGNRFFDPAWDTLRLTVAKGPELAERYAAVFDESLDDDLETFMTTMAEENSFRPPFVLIGVEPSSGHDVADFKVTNTLTGVLGGKDLDGKPFRQIASGEIYELSGHRRLAVLGVNDESGYTVEVRGLDDSAFKLIAIVADGDGDFRKVVFGPVSTRAGARHAATIASSRTSFELQNDIDDDGIDDQPTAGDIDAVSEPDRALRCAVQFLEADATGHVAVLVFNKAVSNEFAEDLSRYNAGRNVVTGVTLQQDPQLVLLGLQNPISPFVENPLLIKSVSENLQSSDVHTEIETVIQDIGGQVRGRVLEATGDPISGAVVSLTETDVDHLMGEWFAHVTALCTTDANGAYEFNYVRKLSKPFLVETSHPKTGEPGMAGASIVSPEQIIERFIRLLRTYTHGGSRAGV